MLSSPRQGVLFFLCCIASQAARLCAALSFPLLINSAKRPIVRMNSSYESFELPSGWQATSAGKSLDGLCVAGPGNENAQQLVAGPGPGEGEETTTASSHWPSLEAPSLHIRGACYGSEKHIPCSSPAYTTSQLCWDDGITFTEVSDFGALLSSFTGPDMDHFQVYHLAESQAQSLPLMPAVMTWATIPEETPPNFFQTPHMQDLSADTPPQSPPDLYHCTGLAPTLPPIQNLAPTDPLRPRSQPLRFANDLYTPSFVRGEGSTRSGWCGYCTTWHTLKDSAYWYHMHFAHGISCATGTRLPDPTDFRTTLVASRGAGGDWEALCGGCGRWVLVVTGEKGRTAWFRHAYKCQQKSATGPGSSARQKMRTGMAKNRSARKVAARSAM